MSTSYTKWKYFTSKKKYFYGKFQPAVCLSNIIVKEVAFGLYLIEVVLVKRNIKIATDIK